MNDWFTIEAIDSDTYAISEYRHWEETHAYLLIGSQRALLIETGLGVSDIRIVVESLTDRPIDVVTTHVHWDHIGGHGLFDRIAVHTAEADWLSRFPLPPQIVRANLCREPCAFPEGFDPDGYEVYQGVPSRVLADGDTFALGERNVQVVHTPGHSPGHICLYEPDRCYCYTGDLIYRGTLYANYPSTDPQAFLRSVDRISQLPLRRILPGHHALDIPASMVHAVCDAFSSIEKAGQLHHGGGLHTFEGFSILV